MNSSGKIANFIGKTLLAALGVGSTVWAFTDAFSIEVNLLFLWIFILVTSLIFGAVMRLKHKNIIILVMCGVLITLIVWLHKYIGYGLYGIANAVLNQYNEYFGMNIGLFTINKKSLLFINTQREFNTFFLSIVAVEYVYILTTATMYKVYSSIHYIMSVTVIIIPLMLGVFPGTAPTIFVIYYFIACAMESKLKNIHLTRLAVMAAVVGIIYSIMFLCVKPSEYNGERRNKEAREFFQVMVDKLKLDIVSEINDAAGNGKFAVGGINGGELGEIGNIEYSGDVMFKLVMDEVEEDVYIKGFVGNDYKYNKWTSVQNEMKSKYNSGDPEMIDLGRSVTQDFENLSDEFNYKNANYMTMNYVKQNTDYVLFPYFSDLTYSDTKSFVMPEPTGKANYEYLFYSLNLDEALNVMRTDEENDGFYSSVSMGVSVEIADYFSEIIPVDVRFDGTPESVYSCVSFVKDYLKKNTRYSLRPGKLPEDEDFVLYFLREIKMGYCTSYASAATLMFRYMGIPARYVEGYLVDKNEINYAEKVGSRRYLKVKDNSAHAWTEIYINGFGFVPIETTPGYYTNTSNQNNQTETNSEKNTEATTKTEDETKDKEKTTTKKTETQTKDNENNNKLINSGSFKVSEIIMVSVIVGSLLLVVIAGKIKNIKSEKTDYRTSDNRYNINALSLILDKELEKRNIECGKNVNPDVLAEKINKIIDVINSSEKIKSKINKGKNIHIPDKNETINVLWIINKCKYADENVKISDEEMLKVSKYVEELKNCLHYIKNRL